MLPVVIVIVNKSKIKYPGHNSIHGKISIFLLHKGKHDSGFQMDHCGPQNSVATSPCIQHFLEKLWYILTDAREEKDHS